MGNQVAPRISFRRMHDMGSGKSLSYVCSGLFYKPNPLFFYSDCGIRVASMSSVDSIPYSKRCSHISMGVLILLIIEIVMSILFQTGVLLVKWIRSFSTSARSTLSFLTGVCVIRPQVAFVFPPSHPFSSRTQIT